MGIIRGSVEPGEAGTTPPPATEQPTLPTGTLASVSLCPCALPLLMIVCVCVCERAHACVCVRVRVRTDRYVIYGNHRDSWVHGAIDPSSGTSVMLEVTRVLGSLLKQGTVPTLGNTGCFTKDSPGLDGSSCSLYSEKYLFEIWFPIWCTTFMAVSMCTTCFHTVFHNAQSMMFSSASSNTSGACLTCVGFLV